MIHQFTSDSARAMAAKSHEQRRINRALREQALAKAALMPDETALSDPYVRAELSRAREHINRINGLLDKEEHAQTLERLARALNVLSERERVLAGRPLPGSFKPAKPKLPSKPIYAVPIGGIVSGNEDVT